MMTMKWGVTASAVWLSTVTVTAFSVVAWLDVRTARTANCSGGETKARLATTMPATAAAAVVAMRATRRRTAVIVFARVVTAVTVTAAATAAGKKSTR